MKFKITILLAVCLFAGAASFAQVRTDINSRERSNSSDDEPDAAYKNNAHDYSIGVGLGSTKMYGDLPYSNPQPAYMVYFEKNISQSVSFGETVSIGDLSSHGLIHSFNHYTSLDQHITIELGTLIHVFDKNYNDNIITRIIGGFYIQGGVGIINNDLKKISNPNETIFVANTGLDNPVIEKNSTALYFPLCAGFNLHIKKLLFFRGIVFNANFQYSDCQSDYIDGYNPPSRANNKLDVYTVMSLGVRFYITHNKSEQ